MAIKISGNTIIDDDRNVVSAGVITATTFVGDGSGLTGVGIGTDGSVNTSGIITATKVSANEFIGTGDKLIFSPTITSFSPVDGATDVNLSTNIILTFDQPIYAGVGSIFLRNSSGIGTEIEAIGITSSMINNQTLTISPSGSLPTYTDVYVVLPQGVVTNALGGNNTLLDTYNFTTVDFTLSSINPTNGATNVGVNTSITLSFNLVPTRGTGTITLRSGSAGGTTIESFDAATSPRISVVGNDWILDPTNNLNYSASIYTVIPSTAINGYVGLNTTGADSHSFTTEGLPALGSSFEGGYLICNNGGVAWIVAPSTSQVTRDWYLRTDANTRAQQVSGCTGWFVPTITQLQNPGYVCRTYWDTYNTSPGPSSRYWSDTQRDSGCACRIYLANGNYYPAGSVGYNAKPNSFNVRSFRCITY